MGADFKPTYRARIMAVEAHQPEERMFLTAADGVGREAVAYPDWAVTALVDGERKTVAMSDHDFRAAFVEIDDPENLGAPEAAAAGDDESPSA